MTRRLRGLTALLVSAGMMSTLFQGCGLIGPIVGVLGDCISPGALTGDQFDDLNLLAQLGYEENNCGRYVPRDDLLGDLGDLLD